nr:hypothetical protein GCM10020092_090430 [Actinoplanes digitatis]
MILHGLTDPTTILATGGIDEVKTGEASNSWLTGAGMFTAVLILAQLRLVDLHPRAGAGPARRGTSRGGLSPCICRQCHPSRSGSMPVLVEDAAEAVTSVDVQVGEPVGSVIRSGSGASGRALAMPWCGRWVL